LLDKNLLKALSQREKKFACHLSLSKVAKNAISEVTFRDEKKNKQIIQVHTQNFHFRFFTLFEHVLYNIGLKTKAAFLHILSTCAVSRQK
jgi:hypothetical protein